MRTAVLAAALIGPIGLRASNPANTQKPSADTFSSYAKKKIATDGSEIRSLERKDAEIKIDMAIHKAYKTESTKTLEQFANRLETDGMSKINDSPDQNTIILIAIFFLAFGAYAGGKVVAYVKDHL